MNTRGRAVLAAACAIHFLHDGFADVIYVLLPIWASELGLSFVQVGVIRSAYSGGMTLFQMPAGFLAERRGERLLLIAGTAVTAAAFVATAGAVGFASLTLLLFVAGLGSGVQHPLSSALVSKAYETGARRAALGTYNFSGDLGKVAVPAAVALGATALGWRVFTSVTGLIGLGAAALLWILLHRLGAGDPEPPARVAPGSSRGEDWGIRDMRGFQALTLIGMIDNATRSPFLTFLPFVLMAKGATVAGVGIALALIFAGGALGKLVCGLIAERLGVIRTVILTEIATTVGIVTVVVAPLTVGFVALVPVGIALNGTSSVLYGTVADLVTPARRSRAFGLYYTLTVATSALAPTLYGLLSDAVGVPATLVVIGTVVLVTVPLCFALRPALALPTRA